MSGTTASERTVIARTACHQSALLKSWGENGLVKTVHMPNRLEIAPMTEHTQNTAGCAIRRSLNSEENLRMMYRMSTKRNTMDTHQMTVIAAWKTRYTRLLRSAALPPLTTK